MFKWEAGSMPYEYKKNNRQLAVTIILICIIALLAILMQPSNAGQATVFSDQYIEYIVEPGDTLWSIAREHRAVRQDIRDVIWEIREVNEITPMIYPGQAIWVPLGVD